MASEPDAPKAPAEAGRLLGRALIPAAVMFACVAVATAAPAAAVVSPTLTIVPATALEPGAQVAFIGSGFAPGVPVRLAECDLLDGASSDPSRCTAIADSLFLIGPDGTVRGTATIVTGPVGTAADAACPAAAPARCAVVLLSAGAGSQSADAPIAFSSEVPVGPPPPPPPAAAPAPGAPVARPEASASAPPEPPQPARPASVAVPAHPAPTGTSRWTFGLVGLVVAGVAAGVGRARRGLRRRTGAATTG